MTASIADVAAKAGVSVATVSRALRGLPNVAESTRERVLDAARQLDYVVNPHASRLAAGTNRTIGAVMPVVGGWYYPLVLAGLHGRLSESGYDVQLYPVATPDARNRFLTTLPFRKRVDGLVLVDLGLSDPEQRMLAGVGTALVAVGTHSRHFPSVSIDNVAAAECAVQHLIGLGHHRIAMIGGADDSDMNFTVPQQRRGGYHAALRAAGIDPDTRDEADGCYTLQGGARAMAELLQRRRGHTAVFAQSDEMAIGALSVLRDRNIAVPANMSVVGFDDHEVTAFLGLSSVSQPMHDIGATAADVLLETLHSGRLEQQRMVLPTHLKVRDTTGPPRPERSGRNTR